METIHNPLDNGKKNVCVFCSASSAVPCVYREAAYELGRLIGQQDYNLTYGGTSNGLMGDVRRGVHETGGHVIGILAPAFAQYRGGEDECMVAPDLADRKSLMALCTNVGFITLLGGLGTHDEFFTVVAAHQAQKFSNPQLLCPPVILLNTNNKYEHLIKHLESLEAEGFTRKEDRDLYTIVATPCEAMKHIREFDLQADRIPEALTVIASSALLRSRPCKPQLRTSGVSQNPSGF